MYIRSAFCLGLCILQVSALLHEPQDNRDVFVPGSEMSQVLDKRQLTSDIWTFAAHYDIDDERDFKSEADSTSEKEYHNLLHLPKEVLSCGRSPFHPQAISAAMAAGLEIIQRQVRWKNKPREQPHWYNNHEGFDFPDCTEGRMFEFPILVGGEVHQGGRTGSGAPPGAHRVIFKADEDGATYCGLITHEGAQYRGSFIACT